MSPRLMSPRLAARADGLGARVPARRSPRGGVAWVLDRRGFAAITLGHVIITNRRASDRLLAHELGHVGQHERWGPGFYLAYLLGSVIGYRRNPFERAAQRHAVRVFDRDVTDLRARRKHR